MPKLFVATPCHATHHCCSCGNSRHCRCNSFVVVVVGYCMFALLFVVLCTLYVVGLIVQAAATNGINTRNTSSSIFARTSFATFSEIVFNDIKIAKITKPTHTATEALSLPPSLSLSLSLAHSLVGNQ